VSWGHTCTVDCRLWTLERTSGTRAPRVGAAHPGVPTRAPSADRERRGHFELLRSLCKRSAGGRAPLVGVGPRARRRPRGTRPARGRPRARAPRRSRQHRDGSRESPLCPESTSDEDQDEPAAPRRCGVASPQSSVSGDLVLSSTDIGKNVNTLFDVLLRVHCTDRELYRDILRIYIPNNNNINNDKLGRTLATARKTYRGELLP